MIPIIDLFAGPGGLGEGFSSFTDKEKPVFKIKVSIEKDEMAHKTLLLRAFFRQFAKGEAPERYYEYLSKDEKTEDDLRELFDAYPNHYARAKAEAIQAELGKEEHEELITSAIGKQIEIGGNWVLIGGPPCQAYSLAGRSRLSKLRKEDIEKYEEDEKHTLYREYLKIIAQFQPAVFVMENVKGMLSSKLQGGKIFDRILDDLENPLSAFAGRESKNSDKDLKYNVSPLIKSKSEFEFKINPEDFIVKAEEYGIPQARHRVLLLGIRSDISKPHRGLSDQKYRTVNEVISDLPKIRSKLSKGEDSSNEWKRVLQLALASTWFGSNTGERTEKLWSEFREALEMISQHSLTSGSEFICACNIRTLDDKWYSDPRLSGVCNHSARGHIIEDLYRYLYASTFAKVYGRSPSLKDFPQELLPKHKNVSLALNGGMFSDRFKVQMADKPATTITSHISKDGHYFIHPDPTQCRSLTVREAARLQTFPDNYLFEGPRTSQYQQVGNAVPPYLAKQIAEIVYSILMD